MKRIWVGRILSILQSLLFAFSAVMKLIGSPQMVQGMEHLELPRSLMRPLGVLELSCAVVYLIPKTSVLGAILLTGYIGGAMLTHLRIGEPIYGHVLIGIVVWLGLYLRRPQLHEVLWPRGSIG
jgi:DoxX-like family